MDNSHISGVPSLCPRNAGSLLSDLGCGEKTNLEGPLHHSEAVNVVFWRTSERLLELPWKPKIGFVSPIVSTVCAAWALKHPGDIPIEVSDQCRGYAEITGLSEALIGQEPVGLPSRLHGATYSRLTRLFGHYDVKACNKVISDVLYTHLDESIAYPIASVVGELHDNVASHAEGAGFSAAQVYDDGQRLEFSVTDCGCGMLHNVQRVAPHIGSDVDAIDWCLEAGHTTAPRLTGMEQRLPNDYQFDPFPAKVGAIETDMLHHVGLGLFQLTELITKSCGRLWIWTGDAQMLIQPDGSRSLAVTDTRWDGLAIEISLNLEQARSLATTTSWQAGMTDCAKRMGL